MNENSQKIINKIRPNFYVKNKLGTNGYLWSFYNNILKLRKNLKIKVIYDLLLGRKIQFN